MMFVPEDYLNENYHYYFDGSKIIVQVDENTCVNIYTREHYFHSSSYSCSQLEDKYLISFDRFTSDIYYRNDLAHILIIFTIIVLFGFGIPFYLFKKFKKTL